MSENNPFEHDLTQHTTEELANYLEDNAKWVRKEAKYLQTEINGVQSPMPHRRPETIEERLEEMAEMARIVKERRKDKEGRR